jgi:hypothetical protein
MIKSSSTSVTKVIRILIADDHPVVTTQCCRFALARASISVVARSGLKFGRADPHERLSIHLFHLSHPLG